MPSPTIATFLPFSCKRRISFSLSCGNTSATTLSTPTCFLIASAVLALSPVSMTTSIPKPDNSCIACLLVGFTTSATATTPISCPPLAKNNGVFPSTAIASPSWSNAPPSMPCADIRRRFPARQVTFWISPIIPCPGICLKLFTGRKPKAFFSASSTIASASGCSDIFSREAATCRSSSCEIPSFTSTFVTTGVPCVIVPVLSKTTVSMLCATSRASADLIKMPFDAPFPVPTMIAVGVARPRAQGQDMTRMEIPIERANSNPYPAKSHTITAIKAMPITTGTNTPLTLSASFAIGAFELVASSTSRTICANVVSSPTFVACILK